MPALADLWTEVQQGARVVHVIFDKSMLAFVNLEQEEAVPAGVPAETV